MPSEPFDPIRRSIATLTDVRIAVVDEVRGQVALRRVLASNGASVITASSYEEAVGSLELRECDVLIASLELPGASIRALERMVRSLQRTRACVALTTRGDGGGLEAAWRAGFRMCVRTPCAPELVANAAAIVGGFSLRR